MSNVVYALHRPGEEYRYIGVTRQRPAERLGQHRRDARKGILQWPVYRWMRKYSDVSMTIIDVCDTYAQALAMEAYWLAAARAGHVEMLNVLDGGAGGPGREMSDSNRAALIERNIGNTYGLGSKKSEAFKSELRLRNLGNTYNSGKRLSVETKAKISTRKLSKGKPTGVKRSPEHIESMVHGHWHKTEPKVGCSHCFPHEGGV